MRAEVSDPLEGGMCQGIGLRPLGVRVDTAKCMQFGAHTPRPPRGQAIGPMPGSLLRPTTGLGRPLSWPNIQPPGSQARKSCPPLGTLGGKGVSQGTQATHQPRGPRRPTWSGSGGCTAPSCLGSGCRPICVQFPGSNPPSPTSGCKNPGAGPADWRIYLCIPPLSCGCGLGSEYSVPSQGAPNPLTVSVAFLLHGTLHSIRGEENATRVTPTELSHLSPPPQAQLPLSPPVIDGAK